MAVVGILTDTTASIPPVVARELRIKMISYARVGGGAI
jgi:hypothetical protein